MPACIWGTKDREAPSFTLILNSQKENLQIISAPHFTILGCSASGGIYFAPAYRYFFIVCIFLLFFVTADAFCWQVLGLVTWSCLQPATFIHSRYSVPSDCSWTVVWWLPSLLISPVFAALSLSLSSFLQNLFSSEECFRAFPVYENKLILCKNIYWFSETSPSVLTIGIIHTAPDSQLTGTHGEW